MKPVYETERRSSNRWISAVAWAFGVFFALSFCGMVVAQVAVQLTPPVATAPQPPIITQGGLTLSPDHPAILAAAAAPAVVKWEYKTTEADIPSVNKAGQEGWELVTVAVFPLGDSGNSSKAYFKRPQREDAAAAAVNPKRGESPGNGQSDSQALPAAR